MLKIVLFDTGCKSVLTVMTPARTTHVTCEPGGKVGRSETKGEVLGEE